MAGPTPQGFETKTYEQILSEIEAAQRAAPEIGADAILDEFEWIGQNNAIFANKAAELWELGRLIYNSGDPRSQEGYILAALSAFTGTKKSPATYTRAPATVNLDAGFTLVAGSTCHVEDEPTRKFQLVEDVTNSGGSAANVAAVFEAIDAGPVEALAGTLTVIAPSVAGWNSVTNATDAVKGANEEDDPTLRIRRLVELGAQGSATFEGIRSDVDIADVEGVVSVSLLENPSNATVTIEGIEIPAHTVALFIWDGVGEEADDQEVANALFDTIGAGIGSLGDVENVVTDEQGDEHEVNFYRLTPIDVYIRMTVTYDPKVFDTTNGPTEIRDAVLARGLARQARGRNVLADQYQAAALSVAGTEEVSVYRHGTSDPGAGGSDVATSIAIGGTEIALLDSSRIWITCVEATP